MRLRLKRRTSAIILLLIVAGVIGWAVLEVFAESQGMNRAFFYFVVTGNGEDKMSGYYGWTNSHNTYARIDSTVDIMNLTFSAKESGYETVLVTDPSDYDPYPPRVAIRNRVLLYPNNVPINFTIVVQEDSNIRLNVNSDYYLRDGWMRSIFSKMLQNINISPSILSEFELAVNLKGTYV